MTPEVVELIKTGMGITGFLIALYIAMRWA